MLQGFHIITYALHIYYLNLFIAFLTPKVEPMTYDDEDDEDAGSLPTSNQSEFKPFIRRLPEFKVNIFRFYTSPLLANRGKLIQKFFWNFHFPGRHTGRFTGNPLKIMSTYSVFSILGLHTECFIGKLIHSIFFWLKPYMIYNIWFGWVFQ